MKWEILYDNWDVFTSDTSKWIDLRNNGVVKIILTFPTTNKIIFSGWDVYCLEEEGEGLRLSYWKDEEPSDPYYGKGRSRLFFDNETSIDTDYIEFHNFYHINPDLRKRGRWVNEELAIQMGIL